MRTLLEPLLTVTRRGWRRLHSRPTPQPVLPPVAICPVHPDIPCKPVPFVREADMVDSVVAAAPLLAAGATSLPFREVSAARGVADVIFAEFDPVAVTDRSASQAAAVPDMSALRCLLALAEGVSIDDLATRAGISRGHLVGAVLPRLAEHGWVVREGRSWQARSSYRQVTRSMVAVELKRDDWRGALRQASWHAEAADLSWVVLDATRVRPALAAEAAFVHAGVGLASVTAWPSGCLGTDGPRVTVHIQPSARHQPVQPDSQALLAERCLSLWLAGESSGPERHVFGQRLPATPG